MHICRRYFAETAVSDIFTFTFDRMRRYQGAWHVERKPMFPGYVFLETEDGQTLEEEWRHFPRIAKILGNGQDPLAVRSEEERFLRDLCDKDHHCGMSRGYLRDGDVHVTEGTLCGKERYICRIDRHKRLAQLVLPGEDRMQRVEVGLEIVSKI